MSSVQQLAGDLVAGVAFLKTRPEVNPANADFTVATIPDIDHWMWVCTQPSEPGKPCAEMQFSPKVLDLITNWIHKH